MKFPYDGEWPFLSGLLTGFVLFAPMVAFDLGKEEGRQSVQSVACEPSVIGLRKNGKEIPLTSAQRDSLSGAR